MYGCESWTIKKAEHRKIDAFELWCWRKLLRLPWTARRSNQTILKEISPGCSLEGLMLKLKLQYFGYLKRRTNSLEKTLMLGKIEGRRRRGWQRMNGVGDGQGGLACCSPWGCKESDVTGWLNLTDLNWKIKCHTKSICKLCINWMYMWTCIFFYGKSYSINGSALLVGGYIDQF